MGRYRTCRITNRKSPGNPGKFDEWVYDYCRNNLNDSIATSSAALVTHLEGGVN